MLDHGKTGNQIHEMVVMVDTKTGDTGCDGRCVLFPDEQLYSFLVVFLINLWLLWPENQLDLALLSFLASKAQERPIIFFGWSSICAISLWKIEIFNPKSPGLFRGQSHALR